MFTLPFYADAAQQLSDFRRIYFAYDPYQFYQWDAATTLSLQRRMMAACDAVFAVSRLLAEDLAAQTDKPVFYLPNAVSESFVQQLQQAPTATPADLTEIPRPIIGCTGQMNGSYDWNLIDQIAGANRQVSMVFVGPNSPESAEVGQQIQRVLERNPNIHWLGPKPHAQLPAYLANFDICFNPLAVNDHNNRRSPLRLYDYLATDKPILSTAIAEAFEHRDYIQIGTDAQHCVQLLETMIASSGNVDLAARRQYIARNTWAARAEQFLRDLDSVGV